MDATEHPRVYVTVTDGDGTVQLNTGSFDVPHTAMFVQYMQDAIDWYRGHVCKLQLGSLCPPLTSSQASSPIVSEFSRPLEG